MPKRPSFEATSTPGRACRTVIAVAALTLYASGSSADELDAPMFSFSGFGTLGVVYSSEDQADFTSSIFKPNGAGYTHDWSADVDSLIAAQLTANFTPKLSAVLQVIAEQKYDDTYQPHVEWANIKYQFTPDFGVRVGRIVLPGALASEYRKVGYANPWIRPPLEVYGLTPVTNNDGADASYRHHFGDVTNTVRGFYGSKDSHLPDGSQVESNDQWGFVNTTEKGDLTLNLNYYQGNVDLQSVRAFFDAFRQFGTEGAAIADQYDCNDKRFAIWGFGAAYDPSHWFLMGEWARRESDCFIGDNTAWYISSGYRFGRFTPYVTYARVKADSNTSDPGLTVSALPPFLAGAALGLNAGLNAILAASPRQETISVGARWDFMRNVNLTVQYDHMNVDAGSFGHFLKNIQPGFQNGGTIHLFGVAVDFVF